MAVYGPWLRRWLAMHLVPPCDVDDLVQDVLAVLVRELPAFRHSGREGAFRTWLRGVVLNRLRDYRRRRPPPAAGDGQLEQLADGGSEVARRWDREHDLNVVGRLLRLIEGDFEPQTWRAFRALVVQGRPAAEVAAELGMTVGAVWSAKSRVLGRLRREAREILD